MPSVTLNVAEVELGVIDLFVKSGLCPSKSEARRLIEQGGAFIDGENVSDTKATFAVPAKKELILRAGKKRFVKIIFA